MVSFHARYRRRPRTVSHPNLAGKWHGNLIAAAGYDVFIAFLHAACFVRDVNRLSGVTVAVGGGATAAAAEGREQSNVLTCINARC